MILFLRLLLSAVLLCWLILLVGVASYTTSLPFQVQRDDKAGYVIAKDPDSPLPATLQAGAVLDLTQMRFADRVAALQLTNAPIGMPIDLALRSGDQSWHAIVKTQVDQTPQSQFVSISSYSTALSLLALALITLWRGRDRAARGLLQFAALICIQNLSTTLPLEPLAGFVVIMIGAFLTTAALAGLYVTADALAGDGLSAPLRRVFRWVQFAVCVVAIISIVLRRWLVFVDGNITAIGWLGFTRIALSASVVVSIAVLALGYRNSAAAQRLRIRWVLFSTCLLLTSVVMQALAPPGSVFGAIGNGALQALAVFGFIYAVLRHRLVDVSFIIDRTLVFGFTTALVVALFALLEKIIESFALGKDASISLQAGVTLLVALVLNRIHHRVEHAVDHYVFRRQHRAIAELRRFTRECGFVEQHQKLLELATARVQSAIGGTGVAIYERQPNGYDCRISCGEIVFPNAVDADDPVLLAMRTTQHWVETAQPDSVLTFDGYAFPIVQRERAIGVLMCGARHAERLAPDELDALDVLAREIGRAIYDIRMREYERFLGSLAADRIADPRGEARLLAQQPGYSALA